MYVYIHTYTYTYTYIYMISLVGSMVLFLVCWFVLLL